MRGEGSRGHTQLVFFLAPTLKSGTGRVQSGQGSCLTRPPSSPHPLHPPPGLENWVWAEDMAFVPTAVPWSPEHQIQSLQVTRKQLETEEQAAFPLGESSPRYLYLASKQNNKWGHPRGYRIQTVSFAGGPLPQNSSMGRAFSWGRWVGCVVGGGWM